METKLSEARKDAEKMQKKHNKTLEENRTMKEERAALLSLVRGGGKSQQQKKPAKAIERLLGPIIKVARDRLIIDYGALEKKAQRLERQVSYREKENDLLRSKLLVRLSAETRLRDRKNRALRDVRSLSQKKLTLVVQRDRADARAKALKETLELLEKDKEDLVLQAGQSKIQTRTEGHGRPYTDKFEAHAVKCMSTGISAHQCREQMLLNGAFHKAGEGFLVPEVD